MTTRTRIAAAVLFALAAVPPTLHQQGDPRLAGRWVGTYEGHALTFDFYSDTMLVVNDDDALSFEARRGSLRAWGDTSFTVTYWFVLDRLLLQTEDDQVVTMAHQDTLARPLDGVWRGSWDEQSTIRLHLYKGGVAQFRVDPGSHWTQGEWDRASRTIQFTWLPDSTVWVGQYDPGGNALLFDSLPGHGTLFLHRAFRW